MTRREQVVRGGFPALVAGGASPNESDRALWFDGCVTTYLERDLSDLAAVAGLADFQRLTQAAALRIGNLLETSCCEPHQALHQDAEAPLERLRTRVVRPARVARPAGATPADHILADVVIERDRTLIGIELKAAERRPGGAFFDTPLRPAD